jgi:hypothetical protein
MQIKSDPIHPDDLMRTLHRDYSYFVDEQSRIVNIDLFLSLFTYKYANQIGNFTFWIECGKAYNELHCQNSSGMKFIFPLKNSLRDLIKSKSELQ